MTAIFTRNWTTRSGGTRQSYRVTFTVNGKKRFRQFPKRRQAQAFVESLSLRRGEIGAQDDTPIKFRTVADGWIAACRVGRDGYPPLEPTTIDLYDAYLRNYVLDVFGGHDVRRLKPEHFRHFRDDLLTKGLARTTVKKILGTAKSVMQHAVYLDHVDSNPGAAVTVRQAKRGAEKVYLLTRTEVAALRRASEELANVSDKRLRAIGARNNALFLVLLGTGIRLSEARGLRRQNIEGTRITITQRADRYGEIGALKTARARRTIDCAPEVSDVLKRHLATHNHDLVFPTRSGAPIDPQNLMKRWWPTLCRAASVEGHTIHHLRHYFASRMIASGQNVKEVSAVLGHADEAFTLRTYGHLFHDPDSAARRKRAAEMVVG